MNVSTSRGDGGTNMRATVGVIASLVLCWASGSSFAQKVTLSCSGHTI